MQHPFSGFTRRLFEQILDFLFPPSRRERSIRTMAVAQLPSIPITRFSTRRATISLTAYEHPWVKDAIRVLKFERSEAAAQLFAELLADFLLESEAEQEIFESSPLTLVPMPLGRKRLKERGYNQVTLVLRALEKSFPELLVRTDILRRVKETMPQTSLPRRERLKNVTGVFAVNPKCAVRGMRILLIDDVTTTGATIHHAARALEQSGAKVTALALARA